MIKGRQPDQNSLKLYSQLRKAEISVLFQGRTGRIGLRRFLASARVSGIESGECLCGKGKETVEHILLFCDNQPQTFWSRGAQFQKLISEPDLGALVARQLIKSERLGQFGLARKLLYSQ
ncbi:reverse transcriptase protein [Rutstroemia sp. NJR-2017a BBW]|nr:reverse transcriptase protein [Rutstroemia sp. NJR-2017a BBW]